MSAEKIYESEIVENKTISIDKLPDDLWEIITAFSNADGGGINLGIGPNGDVIGVNPDFSDKLQRDINSLCSSAFTPKIYPEISINSDNVISVYIHAAPAALRPVYLTRKGVPHGARVRVGTSNMQVDAEWIRRFSIAARGGAELITFKADHEESFDSELIDDYLSKVKDKRGDVYKGLDKERILQKLRALTEDNELTLFGLLAFSNKNCLQENTAPTLNVAVTQYAGSSKVNPEDINEVSLDDKEFSGSIPLQFENALKFILSKLPTRSRIVSGGRRLNYLAIPEVAIRETLANALVHRDYSTYSGRVQIDIYSDRVEFTNPGRSIVPIEQLESAHPQTRNPLLMSYLRDLNITEHRGRGITTIKQSLKSVGLSEPTFEHRHDWFVATLYSSAFIKDDDQTWLKKFETHNLKEAQLKALVHLRHVTTGIKNSEYRELNNMDGVGDDVRAKKDLKKLVDLDLLRKSGEKKKRKYYLEQKFV